MSDVKSVTVDATLVVDEAKLVELKGQLVNILEELNKIRPVQFLDFESEYVYNFLGISDRPEDDRLFICVSGEYDNLPSHVAHPLRNSRNRAYVPGKFDGIL